MIQVVNQLNEAAWKDFVDSHPSGNIFQTPEMFQVLSRAKEYKPKLWAAVDDTGAVQALLLPADITLFNGPLHRLTTRAVVHGSVLANPDSTGQMALEKLLKVYNKKAGSKSLFTELRNLSDLGAIQPVLNRTGFVYEDHLNYLIDLKRPEEEVFGAIASRTRSYIRRALRQENLELKEINDRESLRASYDLLKLTYQNAQVPLSDFSLFEAAYDILRPKNMARFSAVFLDQDPIAVSIDLVYKDVVYYWYGGMDRAYSKQHPNELLRWHVIQWGIQNGYGVFDFGGAGKPDEKYGVRDFKAKFGGELVCYGRNICQHSPRLLRLSTLGYGVARRFM